jgi:hypothetical protein
MLLQAAGENGSVSNSTKSKDEQPPQNEQPPQFLNELSKEFQPLETPSQLLELVDNRTGARYCECHIKGSKLVALGTVDVPLDPDEQAEYRANRDIVVNDSAYGKMLDDAKQGRSFSNIVAEYTKEFDPDHPLKIIGGQHRFKAIAEGVTAGMDQYHGIKVYVGLDMQQRLDVQLISNTNIAVSGDLVDRLQETFTGPELRDWCQKVGLLNAGEDFADAYERGGPISVKMARTFITNYYRGMMADAKKFDSTDTTPIVCRSDRGVDEEWEDTKKKHTKWTSDTELRTAGLEYAQLIAAQRNAFEKKTSPKPKPDFPEKALNIAIMAAWAYVAGLLRSNSVRLKRHFALRISAGNDPLNANALAKGRHKTDAQNYRGLGYRTDPRERGRFVELFFLQAEDGKGITPSTIDIAIKQYHVKQGQLDVLAAKAKAKEE